jgi:hypothetical protein
MSGTLMIFRRAQEDRRRAQADTIGSFRTQQCLPCDA